MTSGHEDIVKSFAPYFDAMGSNTFYYGPAAGNSQVAKLVNNMILGVNMNTVAEGLKLGNHYSHRVGLRAPTLLSINHRY